MTTFGQLPYMTPPLTDTGFSGIQAQAGHMTANQCHNYVPSMQVPKNLTKIKKK